MSTRLPSNSPAVSLATTMIATNTPAPSGTPNVLLPTIGTFPPGSYDSKITHIQDAVQNGVVVGVDFVHQLTNSNGQVIYTSFRYYAPYDLNALIQIFASYGLSGALNEVAVCLEEVVDITPKGRSNYLHITARQLKTAASSSTSSASPPQTGTPPVSGLPTSAQPKRRGNLLGSKRSSAPPAPPTPTQTELIDDEDDDFEDFLTEEDDN